MSVQSIKNILTLMESGETGYRKADPTKELPYRDDEGYTFHKDGSYNTPSRIVPCKSCGGTGKDNVATKKLGKNGGYGGYIRCRNCQGNGTDPAELFSWHIKPPK